MSPWLDQVTEPINAVRARLDAQSHRRVIKTHTPLDGLPLREDVVFVGVGGDARDVALSMGDHLRNMDLARVAELRLAAGGASGTPLRPPTTDDGDAVRRWIEDPGPVEHLRGCMLFTVHHLCQIWDRRHSANVALFHYADMPPTSTASCDVWPQR